MLNKQIYSRGIDVKNKPHGFIQWKGTDVCLDMFCVCGESWHFDEAFLYAVECANCGRKYAVDHHVLFIELTEDEQDHFSNYAQAND
ncbi:hypothetical protein LCGC14_2445910 [marine sediment metagenome]|uniref:Uncharacterized protein n=1 Tax=marine sediment metagenome TaxID=412755 RepID=A0A0F9EBF6_9ZZZZ